MEKALSQWRMPTSWGSACMEAFHRYVLSGGLACFPRSPVPAVSARRRPSPSTPLVCSVPSSPAAREPLARDRRRRPRHRADHHWLTRTRPKAGGSARFPDLTPPPWTWRRTRGHAAFGGRGDLSRAPISPRARAGVAFEPRQVEPGQLQQLERRASRLP